MVVNVVQEKTGTMTSQETADILRANLDKTVRITYSNGETDLAFVITVDDEGVVYGLASADAEQRTAEFWTAFSDIENVEPASSSGF
jgi:hypothetical protein